MTDKQRILLPGDGEKGSAESDPTIVLEDTTGSREITDTNLADAHAPKRQLLDQIAAGAEDWGDGFFVDPAPVLVQRGPDGSIIKTTPLNEIPGVSFSGGRVVREDEIKEVEAKPTPVPLSTSSREKLVGILTKRLFNYYRERGPNDPRFNPFRDGIPELPAGSPEHLQPLPGTPLYPATDGQIQAYLRKFIVERVTVINKNRFGGNTLQDLALHIE